MKRIYLSCFFMLFLFWFRVNAQTHLVYYSFNEKADEVIDNNNSAMFTTDPFGNVNSYYSYKKERDFFFNIKSIKILKY